MVIVTLPEVKQPALLTVYVYVPEVRFCIVSPLVHEVITEPTPPILQYMLYGGVPPNAVIVAEPKLLGPNTFDDATFADKTPEEIVNVSTVIHPLSRLAEDI